MELESAGIMTFRSKRPFLLVVGNLGIGHRWDHNLWELEDHKLLSKGDSERRGIFILFQMGSFVAFLA